MLNIKIAQKPGPFKVPNRLKINKIKKLGL